MKGEAKPKHYIKKVDRFLGNDLLNIHEMARILIALITEKLPFGKKILLSLDWTDLHDDKHKSLVLAVTISGRAIPILWKTVNKNDLKGNENRIEKELLNDL